MRGHNRSLVCSNSQLVALDHDFHVHGIVLSVAFVVDIPENVSDSFFRGDTIVTNKDKVTQPSSALRHSTEITEIVVSLGYDNSRLQVKQPRTERKLEDNRNGDRPG